MKLEMNEIGTSYQNPLKIYIIEDDFAVRKSSQILCEQMNLPCFTFGSGEELFEHLKHDPLPVGCAIVDIKLYGMSGLGVLNLINAHYPGIVPVLLTAFGELKQVADVMNDRNVRVIPKPYVGDAFWDAIVESLSIASRKLNKEPDSRCFIECANSIAPAKPSKSINRFR
ncbi:MAG TPA: hypothetical protein DDZ51_23045 [Planctomycetaceae bacterium]|nr:hypothetical protein [Planctomycetaceae bacterium]